MSEYGAKAIETIYDGYRFRSRLEAKVAVFLNAIGIEYRYEVEGFDLGDGIWYLPDFYLPRLEMWLEVKPDIPRSEEREKAIRLCLQTSKPVALFAGEIGTKMRGYYFQRITSGEQFDLLMYDKVYLHHVTQGKTIMRHVENGFVGELDTDLSFFWSEAKWSICTRCARIALYRIGLLTCPCTPGLDPLEEEPVIYDTQAPFLIDAYMKARQARFEHGEKP